MTTEELIDFHQKWAHAYFFRPGASASERRHNEKRHGITLTAQFDGHPLGYSSTQPAQPATTNTLAGVAS